MGTGRAVALWIRDTPSPGAAGAEEDSTSASSLGDHSPRSPRLRSRSKSFTVTSRTQAAEPTPPPPPPRQPRLHGRTAEVASTTVSESTDDDDLSTWVHQDVTTDSPLAPCIESFSCAGRHNGLSPQRNMGTGDSTATATSANDATSALPPLDTSVDFAPTFACVVGRHQKQFVPRISRCALRRLARGQCLDTVLWWVKEGHAEEQEDEEERADDKDDDDIGEDKLSALQVAGEHSEDGDTKKYDRANGSCNDNGLVSAGLGGGNGFCFDNGHTAGRRSPLSRYIVRSREIDVLAYRFRPGDVSFVGKDGVLFRVRVLMCGAKKRSNSSISSSGGALSRILTSTIASSQCHPQKLAFLAAYLVRYVGDDTRADEWVEDSILMDETNASAAVLRSQLGGSSGGDGESHGSAAGDTVVGDGHGDSFEKAGAQLSWIHKEASPAIDDKHTNGRSVSRTSSRGHGGGGSCDANERVTVWNEAKKCKVAGKAAPRRADLAAFLADHPMHRVYLGQDLDDEEDSMADTAVGLSSVGARRRRIQQGKRQRQQHQQQDVKANGRRGEEGPPLKRYCSSKDDNCNVARESGSCVPCSRCDVEFQADDVAWCGGKDDHSNSHGLSSIFGGIKSQAMSPSCGRAFCHGCVAFLNASGFYFLPKGDGGHLGTFIGRHFCPGCNGRWRAESDQNGETLVSEGILLRGHEMRGKQGQRNDYVRKRGTAKEKKKGAIGAGDGGGLGKARRRQANEGRSQSKGARDGSRGKKKGKPMGTGKKGDSKMGVGERAMVSNGGSVSAEQMMLLPSVRRKNRVDSVNSPLPNFEAIHYVVDPSRLASCMGHAQHATPDAGDMTWRTSGGNRRSNSVLPPAVGGQDARAKARRKARNQGRGSGGRNTSIVAASSSRKRDGQLRGCKISSKILKTGAPRYPVSSLVHAAVLDTYDNKDGEKSTSGLSAQYVKMVAWWDDDGSRVAEISRPGDKSFLQRLPFHPEVPPTRLKARARARLRKMIGGVARNSNEGAVGTSEGNRLQAADGVDEGKAKENGLARAGLVDDRRPICSTVVLPSVPVKSVRGHALDRLLSGLVEAPAQVVNELLAACPVTSKAEVPSNDMIMRAVSRIEALTMELSVLDATDESLEGLRKDELVLLHDELQRARALVAQRCEA